MQEVLIVDGYNIINSYKELNTLKDKNLEHSREKLIDILNNYGALQNIKVILVFDGHKVKGGTSSTMNINGTEVIYTAEGETADSVIEKLVNQLSLSVHIYVATSDWEEQKIVLGKGAIRISARELEERIKQTNKSTNKLFINKQKKFSSLDALLNNDIKQILDNWRKK